MTLINDYTMATFNVENLDDSEKIWPTKKNILRSMLLRANADLLFLQEISRLNALDDLVKGTPYAGYYREYTTEKGNTPYKLRNLVTLSKYPISEKRQYLQDQELVSTPTWQKCTAKPPETVAKRVDWERPILYCKVAVTSNRVLHTINLHLKSKNPTDIHGQTEGYKWLSHEGWAEGYFLSAVKHVGQAFETRRLLERILKEDTLAAIVVAGDFNSDIDDVPFKTVVGSIEDTGNPELRPTVLVPCEYNIPKDQRYSLLYHGKGDMLDHIAVSQSLYPYWVDSALFNELLPDKSVAFATQAKYPESDHAPLVARFRFPED